MGNLAITYQHIADILSFETADNALEKTISHPNFNWDAIVIEGSKHLVLPTIFCRLKAKQLLHLLPTELNTYLEEITSINRNRNTSIIKQAYLLAELFDNHNIDYVFLKGTALLLADYYDDIAERMIGDIDIIIDNSQLDIAFNLLKNNDYFPIKQTLGNNFFEHRHLPRLKTKSHISAVELHKELISSYEDKELLGYNVLKKQQKVKELSIPSYEHLLRHNILNYQINDQGILFNSINFRSAYDTLLILRKKEKSEDLYEKKIFKSYFNLLALFFKDFNKSTYIETSFLTSFYLFKLKHIRFYNLWNKLLKLTHYFSILFIRLKYALTNKTYRKALFKDRKRICKHLKSVLNGS